MEAFALIAHRGFSSRAPENTFAAFRLAIESGFCSIETDVQLSGESDPFVVHDDALGRVNDGEGRVAGATSAYLRSLDAGSWFGDGSFKGERIPELGELLHAYKGLIHLHLVRRRSQRAAPQPAPPPLGAARRSPPLPGAAGAQERAGGAARRRGRPHPLQRLVRARRCAIGAL
jgi:hypothetical protein